MTQPSESSPPPSLITGAGGFVGRYLTDFLSRRGERVVGVGLQPMGTGDSQLHCDLLDHDHLTSIVSAYQPQVIYHLAGLVHPSESRRQPRDYYLINVQGTVNVLEAVRCCCPETRVLFVSSAEVYAAQKEDMDEQSRLAPANPYASSKWMAEEACREYFSSYGLQVVIARPFNHSGPGQEGDFVVPDFCRQIALLESHHSGPNRRIEVGNLAPVRDFLDVRDVVRAYAGLGEKGRAGEVYNVCSGTGVSIREILEILLGRAAVSISIEVDSEKYRPLLKPRAVGSRTRLERLLDWTPEIPLETMLAETLQSWRTRLGGQAPPL